ncbi:hypothetical protein NA57DRAFT_77592 [Rhizodiscina lignyota]|uniref:Uncharacterized protein n=1 Tax=Rhizodiscina lignyota TaxID=1504668 RepID=A0A9P4IE25_9PEZI|nr:hypothetical protein NA57DRAFT_77592 [Rhizodiscina lignyota]
MSAIAIYPPDASDPEIVYLQRDPQRSALLSDLSSFSSLTATIPSGPAPPIPRKSSRRGLRLSIVPESRPITPVELSSETTSSPVELPSGSSATSYSSDDSLDRAIKQLEDSQISGGRPPSYTSVDERPAIPVRSPSRRTTRTSRTSSTSSIRYSASYSDVPPEYQVESPIGHPLDPTNSFTLTAAEKEALRETLKDEEADADAGLAREESIYSMHMTDSIPEPISPPSADSKTLRIHARGMHPIRLPLASKELSILVTNSDGTLAYTSTRAKRSTPNFVLSTPEGGNILGASYDRQTILTSLRSDSAVLEPFTITSKGFRRNQSFRIPDGEGREFEWKYTNLRNARGRRLERLILVQKQPKDGARRNDSECSQTSFEKIAVAAKLDQAKRLFPTKSDIDLKQSDCGPMKRQPSNASGILAAARATALSKQSNGKPTQRVLAQLVRSEDAFTQHAKGDKGYLRAGIGGDLVLEPGCTELVPEEVVVATALVMMKKEQDRLRAVQAVVIVAAIL